MANAPLSTPGGGAEVRQHEERHAAPVGEPHDPGEVVEREVAHEPTLGGGGGSNVRRARRVASPDARNSSTFTGIITTIIGTIQDTKTEWPYSTLRPSPTASRDLRQTEREVGGGHDRGAAQGSERGVLDGEQPEQRERDDEQPADSGRVTEVVPARRDAGRGEHERDAEDGGEHRARRVGPQDPPRRVARRRDEPRAASS